jgi:hypothetical protein
VAPIKRIVCLKSRGFSLIDILVAMGLSAVAIVTTIAVISQASRVRRIENLRTSAIGVREQLIKNLSRYDNFQETIHNNANFDCFRSSHNCGTVNTTGWEAGTTSTAYGGGTTQFALRVARGGPYANFTSEVFYDATDPAEGFTDEGQLCSLQSPRPTATAPNGQCPIRVNLYWWNLCSGTCNPGLIGIKVDILTYNSLTKLPPVNAYGFRIIKSIYDDGQDGPFP